MDQHMDQHSALTRNRLGAVLIACALIAAPLVAFSQTPPPVAPPATPAPASPPVPPAATPPAAPQPARPEAAKPAETKSTETKSTEASAGEIRDITARPVLRIKGQSTWDEGFVALKKSIALLEAEAKRLNLPRVGHPVAYFVDSDDIGFTYEAMLPLAAAAPGSTGFGAGFDAAQSPAGRAVVFPFEGAYEDIDTAYEAATAWLDDKNLVSTGKFLEEYEFVPEKADETTMRLKIIVFLK